MDESNAAIMASVNLENKNSIIEFDNNQDQAQQQYVKFGTNNQAREIIN